MSRIKICPQSFPLWGAKNPMFVKVKGVAKLTDAQVGSNEAAAIFTHNQKTKFLAQAKVVFVLK